MAGFPLEVMTLKDVASSLAINVWSSYRTLEIWNIYDVPLKRPTHVLRFSDAPTWKEKLKNIHMSAPLTNQMCGC